ncbi:MAG: metallopeptidase family protein [bacterium]
MPAAIVGPVSTRRDRHGRGLRGPVAPPTVPIAASPAESFDLAVLDAVEHLQAHGVTEVEGIEFAVEDVPTIAAGSGPTSADVLEDGDVPLAQAHPRGLAGITTPVVVLYRRPLESRAVDPEDLADIVHEVIVDRVAHLLGRSPADIDPHYEG